MGNIVKTRAQVLAAIGKLYPTAVETMRMGEDFSPSCKGQIWTGEDAFDEDGLDLFNYYGFDSDPKEEVWTMGVRNPLFKLLEKAGWYAECHDPGTYFLLES